jgi:predicted nuclease of predicted toxin-antitoxin system
VKALKIKLDENLGAIAKDLFVQAGYDTHSVFDEKLGGASDDTIFRAIITEGRCLVTLDTDFNDIFRFGFEQSEGVIILRPKTRLTQQIIALLLKKIIQFLSETSPKGCVWVVEPSKVRIFSGSDI